MGKTNAQIKDLQAQTIKEIIETEKSYYNGLITFQEVYIEPLMKCNPGLPKSEYEKLKNFFIRIQAMITISNELQTHPAFCKKDSSPQDIAQCFIKYHKLFELLKEYILEYENIFNTVRKNITFNKTCNILLKNPKAGNKSISDYAITPIQRITRYSLLLKELLKHLSPITQTQEYEAIQKALLSIEGVIKNVNQRDLSENPQYHSVMSQIPVQTGEITSPNSTKTFYRQYNKYAESYKKALGKKLTPKSEKTLINNIWKNTKELRSKRTLIPVQNPNFNTPEKEEEKEVKSPPKTVVCQKTLPPASPIIISKTLNQKNNFQKIQTYYEMQKDRTCEQCNQTTLKVKINPQLAYYIKQDSNDSKKVIYEAIFSNNQTDNKKIIITACEDAADAAIKNGTKLIFDISSSSMPLTIKILMYETFKAKLEASKLKGQDEPFTIMPTMSKEFVEELEKKIAKRNNKKR